MAGINKKTWKTKNGSKHYYEITYYENGKQKHRGGFESKIEAQLALKKVVTEKNTDITIDLLYNQYIDRHCALNCKTSTIDLYKSYYNKHLSRYSNIMAKDITKRHIENIVLDLKKLEISNKTINGIITFFQAILNYAVDNEYISSNPILRYKKLPQTKKSINFLDETQIKVFLQEARKTKYYPFFATAIYTGMRRGELFALEWSDIDFKNNKIKVNKQIYRGITQTTKTSKERFIDMCDALKNILIEHKKNTKILTKYVFYNKYGNPIHPYIMEDDYFHPIIKRCNEILDAENQIINFRFHDLRHSFATYLLSKNVPVKYIQEQLGHSNARMTLDTYASVLPSVKLDAISHLNSIEKNQKIAEKSHRK